jgi:hypothetical protein
VVLLLTEVFFGNLPLFRADFFARAPVYLADGVRLLFGQQFSAQLLEGPDANNLLSTGMLHFFGLNNLE